MDIEKLRRDIVEEYQGAFYGGGYGATSVDVVNMENATDKEVLEKAKDLKIDISKYQKK